MILLQNLYTPDSLSWLTSFLESFSGRLLLNLLTVTLLIRVIYYRNYRRSDLFLTFFGFNVVIFLITYLLNQVQMSMGAAFGLFAIFSMLRYRTEGLSAKDMTYLFMTISLGLISAVVKGSWQELGLVNGLILACVWGLEGGWFLKREITKNIHYDRVELIVPERRAELLEDLQHRTGWPIHRVDVLDVDFLKDSAQLMVFYYPNTSPYVPQPENVLETK